MNKNYDLKNFYNKVYQDGEQKHFTNLATTGKTSEEFSEILKEVEWEGKKVIDVGCGTGFFAYQVAKKGGIVLGIDYSEEAIKLAKEKYDHKNLSYKKMDINDRMTKKFDVVISIGTLEHMNRPYTMLKKLRNLLEKNGRIIITSPNWTNPRGYILMTLLHLFNAPITLADLHYLTPIEFQRWAKMLNMKMKWRTIDKSWGHGDIMINDLKRRIPNVIKDSKLNVTKKNIDNLIKWAKEHITTMNNDLPHSGATGLYIFYSKHNK